MDDHPPSLEKSQSADALRHYLKIAKDLRQRANGNPARADKRLRLREWQAERLARSHATLLLNARFGKAAQFFLSDLYGPKDFGSRDDDIERILPLLVKMLPSSALRTIALAVELDALTERLDAAMVAELSAVGRTETLDEDAYAAAYRAVGCRPERQRQIELIRQTGKALDRFAKKPLVTRLLALMRRPSHLAGLGDLHEFLERGFFAFRHMGSADDFLDAIHAREQRLLERLFAGGEHPFQ